jgi:hypothetical protein
MAPRSAEPPSPPRQDGLIEIVLPGGVSLRVDAQVWDWDCPGFVDTLKLCLQGVPYAQNPSALCAGIPAPDDRVGSSRT